MNREELIQHYRNVCLVHSAYDVVYSTLLHGKTKKFVQSEIERFIKGSYGYVGATEAHAIYLQARTRVRKTVWRVK